MTFAATSWLLALGALAIPVVLHLVSRGHERRLRVGSTRLMRSGASFRARRLRPGQLLLFLLRCLVLTLVALALAEPRSPWTPLPPSDEPWFLVEPSVLVRAREAAGADLDGVEPRLLEGEDAWSELREADARAPAGVAFEVFVAEGTALRGRRPALHRPVRWTVLPADREPGSPPAAGTVGKLRAAVLHSAERRDDAAFFEAALAAVAEVRGVAVEVTRRELPASDVRADLAVVLTEDAVVPAILETVDATVVLSDGLGRYTSCATRAVVTIPGDLPLALDVDRCSPAEDVDGEAVLWEDAHGRPLLAVTPRENGPWYRFHGRFHPEWGELVLDPFFPRWLASLLDEANGERTLTAPPANAAAEGPPRTRPAEGAPEPPPGTWPEHLAWWLAAAAFAVERLVRSNR